MLRSPGGALVIFRLGFVARFVFRLRADVYFRFGFAARFVFRIIVALVAPIPSVPRIVAALVLPYVCFDGAFLVPTPSCSIAQLFCHCGVRDC